MTEGLKETNFTFPNQTGFYRGKVRDVYYFNGKIVIVASDRISAFDVILPRPIPYKGQILNHISSIFLRATSDLVPNWLTDSPCPNVGIGLRCKPFPIEMVIRGYCTGHLWRQYKVGKRVFCGVKLPDNLHEHDKLPKPIITPTTKALEGNDQDISLNEIVKQGLVSEKELNKLTQYTEELYAFGNHEAAKRGLILVDVKYEFGKHDGYIYLIDEVNTPDSSRYFYLNGYEERQEKGESQKQLSKEFVREWLIANGFQGQKSQIIPEMTDEIVQQISNRYIELFERITGKKFVQTSYENIEQRIEENILKSL